MEAPNVVELRALADGDDLGALTTLLHRAYAALGAMGLNYTAVDQTVVVTRQRIGAGRCFVAVIAGDVVGTVVVRPPQDVQGAADGDTTAWYRRHDVAILGQLGVEPSRAGRGIGQRLIACCEAWARDHGYRWLALHTARPAVHLQTLYVRLGFAVVDEVQWQGKCYRSVIMAKPLRNADQGDAA